eukprot:scaffold25994_cov30-Tisochrysis_lutea.AAC.3
MAQHAPLLLCPPAHDFVTFVRDSSTNQGFLVPCATGERRGRRQGSPHTYSSDARGVVFP